MSYTDELRQKRSAIEQSGAENIKNQHNAGKLTARERLNMLFDEGSFIEIDAFVKSKNNLNLENATDCAEGVISGYGSVNGRLVYAYAQDYTVTKGALTEAHIEKICKVMDFSLKMGAPIVSMLDSQGVKLESGLEVLNAMGKMMKKSALLSGVVPQISMILGTCAGGSAIVPTLGDFTIMSAKNSLMFLNGPSISGSSLSPDEVGGADVCAVKTGTVSVVGENETDCFIKVKELIDYLPSNNIEAAPFYGECEGINSVSSQLAEFVESADTVDVKSIIKEIADNGELFELYSNYSQNIVTGFIRLNSSTVGVVANQGKVNSGIIDIKAAKKASEFVSFCDSFNISVLTITNTTGFETSTEEELNGMLKNASGLLYSFAQATVPKVNLIIGKAYGSAYLSMNSKHIGADIVLAWPSAKISVMSAESAANILFRDKIAESTNPVADRKSLIEDYSEKYANPYVAASYGYVDDVIEADATRPRLINAFEMLVSKREILPARKHGNMPF